MTEISTKLTQRGEQTKLQFHSVSLDGAMCVFLSGELEGVEYEHIKSLKPETKPYYQALIDKRDIPYVRTHPEAITFLADHNDSSLYALPGKGPSLSNGR